MYRFRQNPPIELALVDKKTMVLGTPGFLDLMLRAAAVPGNATAESPLRQLVGTRGPPRMMWGLRGCPAGETISENRAGEHSAFASSTGIRSRLARPGEFIPTERQVSEGQKVQLVATATDADAAAEIEKGVRGGLGMVKTLFLATMLGFQRAKGSSSGNPLVPILHGWPIGSRSGCNRSVMGQR
ncbi:MAG: hypothetical protein CM1200mP2_45200 [Planctomycetaceae bacterium]|nr:MAG: hypothetical protein CM1200mP2_45200 [Planctomycetaceae bacterium]